MDLEKQGIYPLGGTDWGANALLKCTFMDTGSNQVLSKDVRIEIDPDHPEICSFQDLTVYESNLGSVIVEVLQYGTNGTQAQLAAQHLQRLQQKQGPNGVVLLWKGGMGNVGSFLNRPETAIVNTATSTTTFIVLDGTWQEAQSMFRKISRLMTLPRLTLDAQGGPSQYQLRGDYGWKQRFGSLVNDGSSPSGSLLCTVEIVAELLEQAGCLEEGTHLRERLKTFTLSFQGVTPSKEN